MEDLFADLRRGTCDKQVNTFSAISSKFAKAFTQPRNKGAHTRARPELYRKPTNPLIETAKETQFQEIELPHSGFVAPDFARTRKFKIAYTVSGDKGPWVLMLHGVPTNRQEWYPVQELLEGHCRIVNIDMLGLGESSHVLDFGLSDDYVAELRDDGEYKRCSKDEKPRLRWDWKIDAYYIYKYIWPAVMKSEPFFFIAQDWGGGVLFHYASHAVFRNSLRGYAFLDPIALDGYPVPEIQTIGQASQLPFVKMQQLSSGGASNMAQSPFGQAMAAAQQTFVQIFKTMVQSSHWKEFNNYGARKILGTYLDTDYERAVDEKNPIGASSLTLAQHFVALRALAQRSANLSPALLLPASKRHPEGVNFFSFQGNCLIMWGKEDNMMPSTQRMRLRNAMLNAVVQVVAIPDAGHFADIDHPRIVAEEFLNWVISVCGYGQVPRDSLAFSSQRQMHGVADVFQGFDMRAIWKGDEEEHFRRLREFYFTV